MAVPQSGAAGVPMDEIPTPRFDEYFERLAKTVFASEVMREVRLPYETSRGCWWGAKSHCTFCGLNGTTMAFRSKSGDRVVGELTALARPRRGPGFLVVHDRRPNLEPADYSFDEREARLLLACEDGATAAEALATLPETEAADLDVDEVQEFLDGLVASRLIYEEGGRYLALPLPDRRLTPS